MLHFLLFVDKILKTVPEIDVVSINLRAVAIAAADLFITSIARTAFYAVVNAAVAVFVAVVVVVVFIAVAVFVAVAVVVVFIAVDILVPASVIVYLGGEA